MSSLLKEQVWQTFQENNPIEKIDYDQYITSRNLAWDTCIHPATRSNNKWIGHFVSMQPDKRLPYITEQFTEMVSIYGDRANRSSFYFSSDLQVRMPECVLDSNY